MDYKEIMTTILLRVTTCHEITATQILIYLRSSKPTVLDTLRYKYFNGSMISLKNYLQNVIDKYKMFIKAESEKLQIDQKHLLTCHNITQFLNNY